MNKKGFTFIEMLVVILLISIIALMAVPLMTSYVKKGEEDKYNVFLNDVFLATEAYVQKNIDDYPELNEGKTINISMKQLVNEKLISSNLVNPKYCEGDVCTSKKITTCDENQCTVDNYIISVWRNDDGTFSYELR